ncbi:MAG: hypothetical protein IKD07_00585 [Clostridia bacterium]|nr:hypothetical protein [Clostridia bacterium]
MKRKRWEVIFGLSFAMLFLAGCNEKNECATEHSHAFPKVVFTQFLTK